MSEKIKVSGSQGAYSESRCLFRNSKKPYNRWAV